MKAPIISDKVSTQHSAQPPLMFWCPNALQCSDWITHFPEKEKISGPNFSRRGFYATFRRRAKFLRQESVCLECRHFCDPQDFPSSCLSTYTYMCMYSIYTVYIIHIFPSLCVYNVGSTSIPRRQQRSNVTFPVISDSYSVPRMSNAPDTNSIFPRTCGLWLVLTLFHFPSSDATSLTV